MDNATSIFSYFYTKDDLNFEIQRNILNSVIFEMFVTIEKLTLIL